MPNIAVEIQIDVIAFRNGHSKGLNYQVLNYWIVLRFIDAEFCNWVLNQFSFWISHFESFARVSVLDITNIISRVRLQAEVLHRARGLVGGGQIQ